MQDVAANRHDEAGDSALVAADGERIEKRLGRVLVAAVAGVDHGAVHLLRQELHSACRVVAYHQEIGAHRVQGDGRVDQGLALLHRGGRDRHIHDVGAEPLAGELERALRAGRGLEEEIDEGAAAEIVAFLGNAAIELGCVFGKVQKRRNLVPRKALDSQKVAVRKGKRSGFGRNAH